jgi:hypothetical protein
MTTTEDLYKTGKGQGRKKVEKPLRKSPHLSLGGIPMEIRNGKITYKQYIPNHYSDDEEKEREKAELPTGDGDFVRRHIYEVRFDIKDETDDERRKREYKEWWEEEPKGL